MTTHSRDSNPKAQRFFAQFRCPILILTVDSKHSWLLTSTLLYICETEGIWTPDLWHISSVQNRTSTSATYLASLLQLLTANFISVLCTLITLPTFHYLQSWRGSNPRPPAWQAGTLNQLSYTTKFDGLPSVSITVIISVRPWLTSTPPRHTGWNF